MAHEWVLDVLADLQSFARSNDLDELAAHLEEASFVATSEIRTQVEGVTQDKYGDAAGNRAYPPRCGRIDRA